MRLHIALGPGNWIEGGTRPDRGPAKGDREGTIHQLKLFGISSKDSQITAPPSSQMACQIVMIIVLALCRKVRQLQRPSADDNV